MLQIFPSSVQSLSCVQPFETPWIEHTRFPCPSPTPRACSNLCPSGLWCHPTISSSVIPFSSCLQSFPAWGSFSMSQFFASGGQSVGASASASVLPMNIQDWFPLGWTGWISLQSKRLSRVFSSTTVQKHPFFGILEWAVKWVELPRPGWNLSLMQVFTTMSPLGKPRYNTRQVIYKKVNSFPAKAERFTLFGGLPGKDRTRVHSRPGSFLFLLCHLE